MTRLLRQWLRLWFTFEERVARRDYIVSGVALALIKYVGDATLVWIGTGTFWSPIDYMRPVRTLITTQLVSAPDWLLPVMTVWSLPFMWIGVSMSMRRALDAGSSAWSALLFFVPGLNYLYMAAMSVAPTRVASPLEAEPPRSYESRLPRALLAMAAGAGIGIGMLALSIFAFKRYGAALFFGTPFVVGAFTAFLFNRIYPASGRETQGVVVMTMLIIGGIALLTAQEGAVCIAMAAPLAVGIGLMGSAIGRWIATRSNSVASGAVMALVVLPSAAALERDDIVMPAREVRSSIVIDAPPDQVWQHVIAFSPLPEPSELVFRIGIAYPKGAVIQGAGVGAVRRCEFSTGAFVEPITVWEPGRRLAFDVAQQPAPMHEWSPYSDLAPAHLDGYFKARRGEFRLIPIAGGRTRLEGSTWYEMRLRPEGYWDLFADALVHRIHMRVLRHIKGIAEESWSSTSR
jgi:uncharacterized membrane protein YhaH (DUF805 family)